MFAVDPATKTTLGQLTFEAVPGCDLDLVERPTVACGFTDPLPSPDGRWLLYRGTERGLGHRGALWLAAADGSDARELPFTELGQFPYGSNFGAAWSPDSRAIAYYALCACDQAGLHILRVGGGASDDRLVYPNDSLGGAIAWSRNGIVFSGDGAQADRSAMLYHNGKVRFLTSVSGIKLSWSPRGDLLAVWESCNTCVRHEGVVRVADRRGKVKLTLPASWPSPGSVAWSPDGRWVAVQAPHGIALGDLRSHRKRMLTHDPGFGLTWSPDSRTLAYIQGALGENVQSEDSWDLRAQTGDLRTVTLSGHVRTIVEADRAYGGRIVAAAWTRPPAPISYRPAEPAPSDRVTPNGLLADGPVVALAADGDRVAYIACAEVSVWTPASGTVTTVSTGSGSSDTAAASGAGVPCDYHAFVSFYALALSADRVEWAWIFCGCNTWAWHVEAASLTSPAKPIVVAGGGATGGDGEWLADGDLVGGGSFLGFSQWKEDCPRPCPSRAFVATGQTIERIDGIDCPCPTIASSPGPLTAFDVDDGRIAAGGSNATVILDAHGTQLLSIPVSALAAQLSGNDLLVLVRGELRDYDASTGQLLHSRPLPDVSSGARFVGPLRADQAFRLTLEDAARGLAAYVLDGQVHLLRLADGADKLVGSGNLARFDDAGLVYADGARINFIPYSQLGV